MSQSNSSNDHSEDEIDLNVTTLDYGKVKKERTEKKQPIPEEEESSEESQNNEPVQKKEILGKNMKKIMEKVNRNKKKAKKS